MRWGLMRRLKRGNKLMLFLNYKCNLSCDYCTLGYIGPRVESSEIELEEWKYIIRNFPIRLREIRISGGEPMLMPYYAELVNWLLGRGLFVMVFSNFSILDLGVKKSRRLIYKTTYHDSADPKKWEENVKIYKKHYRVNTLQLGKKTVKGVTVGDVCYSESGYTCVGFMYSPAGKLSVGFIPMLEGEYE